MIKIVRGTSLDDATAIHATAVEIDDSIGILIVGPSGSGKSDLALRLIDRGARLVGDDVVELKVEDDRLVAAPSHGWLGLMEVRGVGISAMPAVDHPRRQRIFSLRPAAAPRWGLSRFA